MERTIAEVRLGDYRRVEALAPSTSAAFKDAGPALFAVQAIESNSTSPTAVFLLVQGGSAALVSFAPFKPRIELFDSTQNSRFEQRANLLGVRTLKEVNTGRVLRFAGPEYDEVSALLRKAGLLESEPV
jgi:hypothetical protein